MNTIQTYMSERKTKFIHKGEYFEKHNHYVFTTIVDRNGFCLTQYPFIEEYFQNLHTFVENDALVVLDRDAYDVSKIQEIMHDRFFNVIHSKFMLEQWKDPKIEVGRIPKTNSRFYKSLTGSLQAAEEYFKGVVWFMGGYKMFESLAPLLNRVYIVRLNCDFGEICPDMLDINGMFDKATLSKYGLNHHIIRESEISQEWVKIMSKPAEKKTEVFSEYMKITTENADVREEQKNIPTFHDYRFEEFVLTHEFKASAKAIEAGRALKIAREEKELAETF